MARRLRSGGLRVLASHHGARGRQYADHYKALVVRLGLFEGFLRAQASAVCGLWVEHLASQRDLDEARQQRQHGKGRRPSQAAIARLQKRAGLAWESYSRALDQLEQRVQRDRSAAPIDLAAALAEQNGGRRP